MLVPKQPTTQYAPSKTLGGAETKPLPAQPAKNLLTDAELLARIRVFRRPVIFDPRTTTDKKTYSIRRVK